VQIGGGAQCRDSDTWTLTQLAFSHSTTLLSVTNVDW
jgi:hypothetical protein